MVFSSLTFLHIFLPCVLLIYYSTLVVMRRQGRVSMLPLNVVLLAVSLLFYIWGEGGRCTVLLALAGISYGGALYLAPLGDGQSRRFQQLLLTLVICSEFAFLFYYKYSGFISNVLPEGDFSSRLQAWTAGVTLPLGISFFTFQTISYAIDVYRGEVQPSKSPLNYLTYVTLFPHLVAGPIVRYETLQVELTERSHTIAKFASGVRRFILGLGKKVLIANMLSIPADQAFSDPTQLSRGMAWIGLVAYSLQLYFDFSGYSDMAIGLARMFGFEFPENFRAPYSATSVTDFWRRWHLSLSTWFRDYLYIPLGGNRKGQFRTIFNLLIVFALCGFWHGANWTFLIWGLYHGLFLILERLLPAKATQPGGRWGMLWTLPIVMVGWLIFRSNSMEDVSHYLQAMWGGSTATSTRPMSMPDLNVILAFLAAVTLCIPRVEEIVRGENVRLQLWQPIQGLAHTTCIAAYVAVFVASTNCLMVRMNNPFIYYRF